MKGATSGGLILVALVVGFLVLPEAAKAVIVMIVALLIGFFGWRNSVRRRQLVRGTPTSKVATAAKGYAELRGVARNALPKPLYDPITDTECVWYHVETEKFDVAKWRWRTVASAQSARPFALEDESGLCLVLPEEARLLTKPPMRVRERLMLRHNVRRIVNGEPLYAIGHLERVDSGVEPAVRAAEPASYSPAFERGVASLMSEWKRDETKRRRIFDPNRDGFTDDAEMTAARELARAEVARRMQGGGSAAVQMVSEPRVARAAVPTHEYAVNDRKVTHWMRSPDDDRDYIVSSRPEGGVVAHERRAGFGYLLLFIVVAIVALVLLAEWAGVLQQ